MTTQRADLRGLVERLVRALAECERNPVNMDDTPASWGALNELLDAASAFRALSAPGEPVVMPELLRWHSGPFTICIDDHASVRVKDGAGYEVHASKVGDFIDCALQAFSPKEAGSGTRADAPLSPHAHAESGVAGFVHASDAEREAIGEGVARRAFAAQEAALTPAPVKVAAPNMQIFDCPQCVASFAYQPALDEHLRTAHSVPPATPVPVPAAEREEAVVYDFAAEHLYSDAMDAAMSAFTYARWAADRDDNHEHGSRPLLRAAFAAFCSETALYSVPVPAAEREEAAKYFGALAATQDRLAARYSKDTTGHNTHTTKARRYHLAADALRGTK